MDVPAYLGTGVIAKACRMSPYQVRTALKNAGLIDPDNPVRPIRVSRSGFREKLSDMYDDVFEYYDGLKAAGSPG